MDTGLFHDDRWWHYRQNKHHRWFLDAGQIEAYNIAGALHPSVRWWEAMEIPERSVHFLELGGGITVAAVVCEDLARLDGVAELLRSVGPTLVMTLLLDGPQLASRWTSRYAGVLADEPRLIRQYAYIAHMNAVLAKDASVAYQPNSATGDEMRLAEMTHAESSGND